MPLEIGLIPFPFITPAPYAEPGPCVMCDLMEALTIVIVEGETQFSFWFVKTFTGS